MNQRRTQGELRDADLYLPGFTMAEDSFMLS